MASWSSLRTAVHQMDLDESEWLLEVFRQARELFDEGLGLFAYTYRFCDRRRIELGSVSGVETAPEFWRVLTAWGAENQRILIDLFRTGAATLADAKRGAQESGASLSATLRLFEPHGVKDIVCVAGHDAGGHGVFVSAPRAGAVQLSAVEHRSLSGLATELASTTRLRELRSGGVVARFSAAEQRVVRWLLEGATDKEMAGHLGVTLSTVSSLMRRVRTKLGCRCGQEVLLLTSPEPVGVTRRRVHLFGRLTASERDIATDLLLGASHREMAIRRGTSPRTVAKQCGAVFRKCGVSGRRQLTAVLVGGLSGR